MLASGSPESYGRALRRVLADPSVDAAIVLFIPPLVTKAATHSMWTSAVSSDELRRRCDAVVGQLLGVSRGRL